MLPSKTVHGDSTRGFISISCEELRSNMQDEKLRLAAREGIFYLKIPADCKPFIGTAVNFCNTFSSNIHLKERQFEGFSGYHDRDQSQVEAFYLECRYWEEILISDLNSLALKMHSLALEILTKTLNLLKIPKEDHEKITGKVTGGGGDVFFTFNHYQPEKPFEGLASHRDFGQITILFINQSGLQAKIKEEWKDVSPLEGSFVIIIGKALANSINNSEELNAAWHRVQKVASDRISFAICAGNSGDSLIYQKNSEGKIISTGESYLKVIQASKRYRNPSETSTAI